MTQTSPRRATAIALALVTALTAADTVNAEEPRVIVRVYDTGNSASDARADAIRVAASIGAAPGVAIDWRDCTETSTQAHCRDTHTTWNLIARIMPAFVPGTTAAGGRSVVALKTLEHAEAPLGFAIVDPATRVGKIATIFHDQIETVSRRTGVSRGELLGRALAHEIGHLLLRANRHSRSGLMRAVWTDEELTSNRVDDWQFSLPDRERLQQNLP